MNLEDRYLVIKISDLKKVALEPDAWYYFNKVLEATDETRKTRGADPLECLVIEKDWPEYEKVLAILSERVDREENLADPKPQPASKILS